MPISTLVPPRFSGRDFTSSDYREIIDELLWYTERLFRYGLRREGTYPFAEFFRVPDASERLLLLRGGGGSLLRHRGRRACGFVFRRPGMARRCPPRLLGMPPNARGADSVP